VYVNYPLSLRNVEDLLFERGIDICHETVRLWWMRFGPMFAAKIRRKTSERGISGAVKVATNHHRNGHRTCVPATRPHRPAAAWPRLLPATAYGVGLPR
jgi:hypothetical protein